MGCKDKDGGTHHNACDCREKSFRFLETHNKILLNALRDIKKHQEIVMGETDFNVELSTTWQIANKALESIK